MRKQPLPRNQLRQAILKGVIVSSTSLIISVNPWMANAADIVFADEPETCDFIYGVNDDGLNNSQFFKIDPSDYAITPMGTLHYGLDLEALDVSASGEIYVAAGDNTDDVSKAGYLYKFDPDTGDLTEVCPTGFAEVDGLSFNPNPEIGGLYGWAQDAGLIKITIPESPSEVPCATLIHESRGEFEDLTWSNDGFTLYVVKNDHGDYPHPFIYTNDEATYIPDPENDSSVPHELIAYTVVGDTIIETQICPGVIAPLGEIESLEIDTTDMLLLGYHVSKNKPMMATLDPITCQIDPLPIPRYPSEIIPGQDSDIEAIGVCPCIPTDEPGEWKYAEDPAKDQTGLRALDIHGIAMKLKGNNDIVIAINADMTAEGIDVPEAMAKKIPSGFVSFSDFVMFFANGTKYAVNFAKRSDSGAKENGLVKNPVLKDVTKAKLGFSRLADYIVVLEDEGVDKIAMGDLDLANMQNFLPMNEYRKLNMSIESGERLQNDGYQYLSYADLQEEGLDFETKLGENLGKYTFGFKFKKQMDMKGSFIATLYTECSNDAIAIVGELPNCP